MSRAIVTTLFCAVMSAACWPSDVSMDVGSTTTSDIDGAAHRFGATTDGKTTWWVVRPEDVAKSPDWIPGQEPPVSLSEAAQLAMREVPKYTKIVDAYKLNKIEWLPFGGRTGCADDIGSSTRKWIYLVTFEREYVYEGRRFDARGTLTIPVLLDGTVIQGVTE